MPEKKIQLNASQKKAVEYEAGPLLVVAGAGTGKTRVITQRVKYLIEKQKIKPEEILALTFTDKASQEMLERLGDVMPLGYEEPWIYTFHAFADRLLKKEGLEIGLDPSYRILSGPEQWLLFRRHLFDFELDYFRPLGNPTKFISAILKFISRAQDENISSGELMEFAEKFAGDKEEKKRWLEIARAFKKYEELKLAESRMDFGDLIIWAIKLFSERPNILNKYRKQFKHVLVDEFQDTNYAQYELVKMLCPQDMGDRSLLVVGDDSQSIYKFRGAAVSNILEFQQDYSQAEMITLLQNYRSTQKILDPAYKLIKNNNPDTLESKLGISKELVSQADEKGEKPLILQTDTGDDEVDMVIKKILEILGKEAQYNYKDIAIMARANNHLDPFVFALRKYGLPYQLVGNRGLYDREEVRDMLAVLRVVVNPEDSISLYRVLNIDSFGLKPQVISHMLSQARAKKTDLWSIVSGYTDAKVSELRELIRKYQDEITKLGPSEFVYQIVTEAKLVQQYVHEETIENQLKIKNMDLFLNIVKDFEVKHRQDTKEVPTVIDLIDYVDMLIEAGDNPAQAELEDINTINLMTVHASKGLEFPVVFMVNLVGGRFPTRNRSDPIELPDDLVKESLPIGDAHLQEERRLFYVGMTRAKKYLYMMLAKNYGGKREKAPSGYLEETGLKLEEVGADELKEGKSQVGLFGMESGFREPKAEKITNFDPKFLSYSQIDTYKICPLRYKYSYVLNIPTMPSHNLSFGITIHDTLKDYHSAKMFDSVSLEKLMTMYEKNWQPLGFIDGKHREERFESGRELLRKYYEKHNSDNTKPVAIEKSFNIQVDGVRFFGRIDRIDPLPEGGVEIIDYKTGTPKDQKQVDKDDQVTYYALGVKEALGLEPKKLSLYYLEGGEKVTTTRTEKEMYKKKEEIREVAQKIRSGEFPANPGMQCNWCDYKDICPYAFKG